MRYLATILSILFSTNLAHAHGGHIGELAGHAHWVGLAAGIGAIVLAGLLAKKGKKTDAEQVEPEAEEATGEEAAETA